MRFTFCRRVKARVSRVWLVSWWAVTALSVVGLLFTMTHFGEQSSDSSSKKFPNSIADQPTQTSVGFIAGQPKLAVILASMRTGSEFFGRMFGTNPNIFFPVEPITPLYDAMYGTFWNLQSDMHFYQNGSKRYLPKPEVHEVAEYLGNLLTCNFEGLPTEALTYSPLWIGQGCPSNSSAVFADCVLRLKDMFCDLSIKGVYCGNQFGKASEERSQTCYRLLHDTNLDDFRDEVSDEVVTTFKNYRACMQSVREGIKSKCLPAFNTACQTKSLRIAKTVRASMASMEHLLESIPNFRVIHLIRDPRPVALSRINYPNKAVVSISAGNDDFTIVREAEMYCKIVVDDIRAKQLLEQKYPGRIYTLVYEDLASDNIRYMEEVYKFLDEPVHKDTYNWLEYTFKGRKSRDIAIAWRKKMSIYVNDEIVKRCKEFYDMVDYDWPYR